MADRNILPIAVPVLRNQRGGHFEEATIAGNMPSSTPYLFDLIREGLPCVSVLAGSQVRGCAFLVEQCEERPNDINYQCRRTGRTPLHEAALRCSCLHVIRALMGSDGTRSIFIDQMLNTPLHLLLLGISSRRVQASEMEELVNQLLQPVPATIALMANREGQTPLHCACSAPESMVPVVAVERLLEASAQCASRTNQKHQTPLHLHCQRRRASVSVARKLMQASPDSIRALDRTVEGGRAPLHYAAADCNCDLIQLLVRSDPLVAQTRAVPSDRTALHILCSLNPGIEAVPAVQALLAAAPEAATRTDRMGSFTPLHLLCRSSRICPAIVQALIDASPQALATPDSDRYLPLHHACEVGVEPAVIGMLLTAYPQAAKVSTRKNDSALSLACATNHSEDTVRMLLAANPEATLQANDYGFLPLHCICRAYQPRADIVQSLVLARPDSVTRQTNAGESAVHLASSNTGSSVAVLDVLTKAYEGLESRSDGDVGHDGGDDHSPQAHVPADHAMTSKVGNTPLHHACFRNASLDHIETLAQSNPEWISLRNNAGYSPLQILSKNGRIDDRIVTLFSRICGPEIFASVDLNGNTPLHSAMREETSVEALRALIRAYPEALHMKTIFEDTPLHLACIRRVHRDVVREVAKASSLGLEKALVNSNGRLSPLLVHNTAGQTPIGIAMEHFQAACRGSASTCCVTGGYDPAQNRAFDVLASLVKLLHYGPVEEEEKDQSLVGACVSLHRKDARLDPAFIRRALHLYPEEAKFRAEDGNTPLHVEASIPVEKMPLLDGPPGGCCRGTCHNRLELLGLLLDIYPQAATMRNSNGDLPLALMIQNGRAWDSTFAVVVQTYPAAMHFVNSLRPKLTARILGRISSGCGAETLYALIRSRPALLLER